MKSSLELELELVLLSFYSKSELIRQPKLNKNKNKDPKKNKFSESG